MNGIKVALTFGHGVGSAIAGDDLDMVPHFNVNVQGLGEHRIEGRSVFRQSRPMDLSRVSIEIRIRKYRLSQHCNDITLKNVLSTRNMVFPSDI
jgi:hypothetical protein